MLLIAWLLSSAADAFVSVGVRPSVRHPTSLLATRVFVDLDVLCDTLEVEGELTLRGLQEVTAGREDPWHGLTQIPHHKFRTFDMREKFDRIMTELRVSRAADAVMILRVLFDEAAVGERAARAREEPSGKMWEGGGWAPTDGPLTGVRPGTRPLTAGEIVENWEDILSPRCAASWHVSPSEIDDVVSQLYKDIETDSLRWRPEPLRLLRTALSKEKVDDRLVVFVRSDGPMRAAADKISSALSAVLDGFSVDVVPVKSALDVEEELRAHGQSDDVYFGGSPGLTFQLAALLNLKDQMRIYHCKWIHRWDGRRSTIPLENNVNVRVLETEYQDLRYVLGLKP